MKKKSVYQSFLEKKKMNFESEKRIEFLTSEKKNRTERKNLLTQKQQHKSHKTQPSTFIN